MRLGIGESETGLLDLPEISCDTTGVNKFFLAKSDPAELTSIPKESAFIAFFFKLSHHHPLQTANAIHSRTVWRDVGRRSSRIYFLDIG